MSLTTEKCIDGWTNSLTQLHLKADIVFFGDSLTYYGDFASAFPDKVVCNLGLRGDTIVGILNRIEQLKCLEPNFVFLMVGINDIAKAHKSVFKNKYIFLVDSICRFDFSHRLFIQSILPVNTKCFGTISCDNNQIMIANRIIRDIACERNVPYLDLFSLYMHDGELPEEISKDGIHLKPDGYEKWYDKIKTVL